MPKGARLTLYDKVYRELDATSIGAERQRNVKTQNETRYDFYNEMGTKYIGDKFFLTVHSATRERLNLAERIAQYYGANYEIKEYPWKRDQNERFEILIDVEAE